MVYLFREVHVVLKHGKVAAWQDALPYRQKSGNKSLNDNTISCRLTLQDDADTDMCLCVCRDDPSPHRCEYEPFTCEYKRLLCLLVWLVQAGVKAVS